MVPGEGVVAAEPSARRCSDFILSSIVFARYVAALSDVFIWSISNLALCSSSCTFISCV